MPKVLTNLSRITGKVDGTDNIVWWLRNGGLYDGTIWTRTHRSAEVKNGAFSINAPPSSVVGPVSISFGDGRVAEVTVPEGSHDMASLEAQGLIRWK